MVRLSHRIHLNKLAFAAVLITALAGVSTAHAAETAPIINYDSIFHPVEGAGGMVSSQEAVASQIGRDILAQGGNAVDAAVAVGFALAVTLPRAGNLGGGGFMLLHLAKSQQTIAIDYRETAPAKAHRDMYLRGDGSVDEDAARFSYRASGVPGTVHGLLSALKKYGKLTRQQVLAPAIKLAEQGVIVTAGLSQSLASRKSKMQDSPAAMKVFFKASGDGYQPGERLQQKDLAQSLTLIAKHGESAFYDGNIAQKIVADMQQHGGLISAEDLHNYRSVERVALHGQYKGFDLYAMPPPSSGGVHVLQLLNILQGYDLHAMGLNSAAYLQVLAEAMKHVYADRSAYLGDPDFVQVPVPALLSGAYASDLRKQIDLEKATASAAIKPHNLAPYESFETTHYSVIDGDGNAVSNTYTLNFSYGSHKMVAGTGILLNNEMDDFSAKSGVPNAFGLVGGDANAITARKRPLSSMAPIIVLKDGKVYLVTGSPGGSQIITVVTQVLLNVLEHRMNIQDASNAPRIHHQWLPDVLQYEPGISVDTLKLLALRGQNLKPAQTMGSTQSIMWFNGRFYGASDPRRPDALTIAVSP